MQVFENRHYLGCEELSLCHWKTGHRTKVGKQFTASYELKDHVEVAVVLSHAIKVDL